MSDDPNGDYTFGHDASSNAQWSYAYDAVDRLCTIGNTSLSNPSAAYTYNAIGSRTTVANGYGTFIQRNDGVRVTSPLLWYGQQLHTPGLFSADDNGANLYYEPDALGSTAGILNTAQSQQATYEYDAFGVVNGSSGTTPGSFPIEEGFAGGAGYQEEYGTGGLIRCGNRYYNPLFGRFLTKDPKRSGLNWYVYCGNNPISDIDPTGFTVDATNLKGQDLVDWNNLLNYLKANSPTFAKEYASLVSSNNVYTIQATNSVSSKSGVDSFTETSKTDSQGKQVYTGGTILVNLHASLEIVTDTQALANELGASEYTGKHLSPASIIAHEFGHAYDADVDPAGYSERVETPAGDYTNLEEWWNITLNEGPEGAELGAAQRFNHYGTLVNNYTFGM